jgi:hypothetical protein
LLCYSLNRRLKHLSIVNPPLVAFLSHVLIASQLQYVNVIDSTQQRVPELLTDSKAPPQVDAHWLRADRIDLINVTQGLGRPLKEGARVEIDTRLKSGMLEEIRKLEEGVRLAHKLMKAPEKKQTGVGGRLRSAVTRGLQQTKIPESQSGADKLARDSNILDGNDGDLSSRSDRASKRTSIQPEANNQHKLLASIALVRELDSLKMENHQLERETVDMEYLLKNMEQEVVKSLDRRCMDISGKLSELNEALKMYEKRADRLQDDLLQSRATIDKKTKAYEALKEKDNGECERLQGQLKKTKLILRRRESLTKMTQYTAESLTKMTEQKTQFTAELIKLKSQRDQLAQRSAKVDRQKRCKSCHDAKQVHKILNSPVENAWKESYLEKKKSQVHALRGREERRKQGQLPSTRSVANCKTPHRNQRGLPYAESAIDIKQHGGNVGPLPRRCASASALHGRERGRDAGTSPNLRPDFAQRYCYGIKRAVKHTKPIKKNEYLLAPAGPLPCRLPTA